MKHQKSRNSTTGGQHSFAQIPRVTQPRSTFDRSCGYKTTFDAGYLIPFFLDEGLPGDTMNLTTSIFARLATPLHPILDNLFLDTHFFAVPIRLVFDNWEKLNGAQDDPEDSTDFLVPIIDTGGTPPLHSSIYDYMGIPPNIANLEFSALYNRAIALIWNEWFRDQNLQDSVAVPKDDGPDDPTTYTLLKRGKRHDYFSSSLPWPQKGPVVNLPIGGTAPVVMDGLTESLVMAGPAGVKPTFATLDASSPVSGIKLFAPNASSTGNVETAPSIGVGEGGDLSWDDPKLYTDIDGTTGTADLTNATAATINQMREAFQIQKMYERDARGGTRYVEQILSHFGVTSPDQRLQRPEFLGGGSMPVNISAVAQTSSTDAESPQANLAAYGVAASTQHGFIKSFTEHCIVVGFVSARADLNYQQGVARQFKRRTRFDFYWPSLAFLGEQSVLQQEIYATGVPAEDDVVWGYQERWAEYRYKNSQITGQLRSSFAQSLDTWHLAQDFATSPTLNSSFIEENPPIDRVIAVPSEPHFILDAFFRFKHSRPMPTYSVPGNIDRF